MLNLEGIEEWLIWVIRVDKHPLTNWVILKDNQWLVLTLLWMRIILKLHPINNTIEQNKILST